MKKIGLLLMLFALLTPAIACSQSVEPAPAPSPTPAPTPAPGEEYEIKELNGVKYIVHPAQILGGGPPKDGIPSIDNPIYVSMEEAEEWIEDNELVIAIIYKGVKRVYPLQIMVWHEIVNDVIAGDSLLITY
jgi:hypothetical protein